MQRTLISAVVCLLLAGLLPAQDNNRGSVVGSVLDAATGQPVRQARVEVDGQSDNRMLTDTDGKFRIELSPGTYKLRFTAANYNETTIEGITVQAGVATEASTVMSNTSTVTTIEVSEKVGAVAATAEAMLTERRLSAVVSDSISNEELRGGVAANAAGALEKVTGVSIVDNGYVYVRGLGERYSATMLNNAVIPTTEPEKRVVPLDLFPAALIDNIRILKTYSPDLPGEFAGGLVQMTTVEFPTTNTFRVATSWGFNTRTTFDRFSSYPGGGGDAFGFDDGARSLPGAIPAGGRLFPGNYTEQQFEQFGEAFSRTWQPTGIDSMRPAQSYVVSGGGTFGRFGVVGAASFNNKPQRYQESQQYLRNSGDRPVVFTSYPDFQSNDESARLGAVLNVAMRLTPANKLVLRNTLTRESNKESRTFQGYDSGVDGVIRDERLRWIERSLFSMGLEGEHAIARLANSLFKWQFTYSRSARAEPDLREVIRGQQPNGSFAFVSLPYSGLRFFNDLADRIYEPQAEWSTPFFKGRFSGLFKTGFRATLRSRDFQARRFRFVPVRTGTLNFALPSNELFGPDNIRPDGFALRENTRSTDAYDASMDIFAGYAMADVAIGPKWRIVGGIRVEDADITVNTIDPLIPGSQPSVANLRNRDPLPGVNLIYAATARQNIRASYSRTVSRPDFRELSPFDFTNVLGGFNTVGNPNLRRAAISNFDARWEWFPGGNQIIAASYFLKRFTDPIEVTIQPTTDLRQSFLNAESALNQGIELEYRQQLRRISPRLAEFSVQSNFTFVNSSVTIPRDQALLLTSKERPLVGQSRFLFNLIGEWARPQWRSNARFYMNSVSRRITDVGTFNLPDIYQERNVFLDFVYQFDLLESNRLNLRFSAENLGDNTYRWTQAEFVQRQFQIGRTFSVGVSYSFF